ncbi:molybdopterin molybdotransferase MoeA [Candidatus Ozemobacteraceae bacterium]|nr:molybdopterin molybdotransferase MoeA [Candidatus Ozemobacteraceae bacterium]
MIQYEDAMRLMLASAHSPSHERVDFGDADGRILAEDIVSDIDMPPFDKAAMDGYACRRQDLELGRLTVIDEIPAGRTSLQTIRPGTCARIFTGAPVPAGADTVIMQEHVTRDGDAVRCMQNNAMHNICRKGEDIRSGDIVLRHGERITPAHIAVMAVVGATRPLVACRPKVTLFATGSEIVEPQVKPAAAQIRNSNGWQLASQTRAVGAEPRIGGILADDEAAMTEALRGAMTTSDLIIVSGGVSTGDYDLIPGILGILGFEIVYKSVAIQPGRPTLFGKNDAVFCCGLPGNPVAAFVMFELLVKPFIFRLMGHAYRPLIVEARVARSLKRDGAKRQACIPVRFVAPDLVEPLPYNGPAHISTMTGAEGLIITPPGGISLNAGERMQVQVISR